MAEVDHHLRCQPGFFQPLLHLCHVLRTIVRLFAAAQNDMAVAVAAGIHNGRVAPLGDGEEAVRRPGCVDRVNRHLNGAIGTVFETYRAGEPGRQFAMHLRFGGACANCPPAHQIGNVLRGDHIKNPPRRWQAAVVNLQQQLAGDAQAVIDLETVIHMRIVYQPFPAHGGARLFKIDAHHDLQLTL